MITLAVSNLQRALAFYREGLGLDSSGVTGTDFLGDEENPAGDVAMFHLNGGLILALYPRAELAKDARIPFGPPKSGEFSIGHLVESERDVDALLAQAVAAGASLTGPPHHRPWGSTRGISEISTGTSGRSSGTRAGRGCGGHGACARDEWCGRGRTDRCGRRLGRERVWSPRPALQRRRGAASGTVKTDISILLGIEQHRSLLLYQPPQSQPCAAWAAPVAFGAYPWAREASCCKHHASG